MKELDRIKKEIQIRNDEKLEKDIEEYKNSKEYIARERVWKKIL